MKKLLTLFLTLIISLTATIFVACDDPEEAPQYAEEWSYDDTYHWRAEINGDGYIAKAEHVNKYGKCECGIYFDCPELVCEPERDSAGEYKLNASGAPINGALFCVGDGDKDFAMTYKHIKIPEYAEFNGVMYPVKVIGARAFENEPIESIYFEGTQLVTIMNEAFARTTALKELIIPDNVTNYGTSMTYEAKGLVKFAFGRGCKSIPGYMFYSCPKLEEVIIPDTVTKIGTVAFTDNRVLKSVVIPSSVNSICGHRDLYRDLGVDNDFGPSFNNGGTTYFFDIERSVVEGYVEASKNQMAEIMAAIQREKDEAHLENGYKYTKVTLEYYRNGWDATGSFCFKGEWHYDENGKPVRNS